jgi:hypothetical protein
MIKLTLKTKLKTKSSSKAAAEGARPTLAFFWMETQLLSESPLTILPEILEM